MKTLKLIALTAVCAASGYASAQDLIVKKDGTVIQAQVTKVKTAEVEYKKWNNQDGPLYSISVKDILAINYKNGEKETFENAGVNETAQPAKDESEKQQTITPVKPEDLSPEAKAANDALIAKINAPVNLLVKEKNQKNIGRKKADKSFACFGITPNSILCNDDIEVTLDIGRLNNGTKDTPAKWETGVSIIDGATNWATENPAMLFSIKNKTAQTIYLDLANTFYVRMGQSTCYYVPTSTTTTSTSSQGGSVNLGAITGAVGIGGVIGKLANGVNVGGGSSNTATNTTYSQRVIAIAPLATVDLSPQYIFGNEKKSIAKGLQYDIYWYPDLCAYINFSPDTQDGAMMFGDHYVYNADSSPLKISFHVAYTKSENCLSEYVLSSHYFLNNLLGAGWKDREGLDNSEVPYFLMAVTAKRNEESFPKQ